jgi:hypothetical protein
MMAARIEKGRAMTPEMSPAQPSTAMMAGNFAAELPRAVDDYDDALGWECANPALQIDAWRHEAAEAAN